MTAPCPSPNRGAGVGESNLGPGPSRPPPSAEGGRSSPGPPRYTSAMDTNPLLRVAAIALLAALAGCGNKGPLMHPPRPDELPAPAR